MKPLLCLSFGIVTANVFVLMAAAAGRDVWSWLVPVGLAAGGVLAMFSGGLAHREAKRLRDAAAATADPEDDKRVALAADALDELGVVLATLSGHPALDERHAEDLGAPPAMAHVRRARVLANEARRNLTPLGEMKPGGVRR